MSWYNNNGTTNTAFGNWYNNDGSANHLMGNWYNNDGTTNNLLWNLGAPVPGDYLFNWGNQYTDWTGGWIGITHSKIIWHSGNEWWTGNVQRYEVGSGHLFCGTNNSQTYNGSGIRTVNRVNLTYVNSLTINYYSTNCIQYNVGIIAAIAGIETTIYAKGQTEFYGKTNGTLYSQTIDVSSVTSAYVYFGAYTSNANTQDVICRTIACG